MHVDQRLATAEIIKFLGLYFDSHQVSHKCIIKEAELCMFYDEKIILHKKYRCIKNGLLCMLSVTDKLRYNFWGLINKQAQCIFYTKKE